MDNILIGAGAASMFVKVVLDILSIITGSSMSSVPRWLMPALSMPMSILIVVLLIAYEGELVLPLSVQAGATIVLTAIMTAGSAVGVTELSARAEIARRSGP